MRAAPPGTVFAAFARALVARDAAGAAAALGECFELEERPRRRRVAEPAREALEPARNQAVEIVDAEIVDD